jgi:hypothetical protein
MYISVVGSTHIHTPHNNRIVSFEWQATKKSKTNEKLKITKAAKSGGKNEKSQNAFSC